jgi:membrane protein YqaA with SNARE-associated domain
MLEWVQAHLVAGTPVWAMLGLTFLAATVIPLGAEVAVVAIVRLRPELYWPAILVAAAGHTLACMVGFGLGYLAHGAWSKRTGERFGPRYEPILRRYGPPAMLLTAVPGVGDPFGVVAGWFRLPPVASTAWCAVGKLMRFCVLGAGVAAL